MIQKWIYIFPLIASSQLCNAQEFPERDYDLGTLAESLFPVQDLDIDYAQLYENLAQILSNPINLNSATDEELRSLYVLSEQQIKSILSYRAENGSYISIYELQSIEGIDEITFYKLIPFVTARQNEFMWKNLPKRIANEQNNYLLLRLGRTVETRKGFENNDAQPAYRGSPERIYTRFRTARASDFSLGFTLEKDAGESFNWSPSQKYYGFDYTSYHLQVLNKGILSNLIIGDYQAQFGQGLILGGGFGIGKGAESVNTIRRSNIGFIPYTSINESGYFRGAAISLKLNSSLTLHTLASSVAQDGVIAIDSLGISLSSLPVSGLHRTESEINNRKSVRENNVASILNFKNKSVELGAIVHHTHFESSVNRNPSPYNQFTFRGADNVNTGFYFNYATSNATFFSEFCHTIKHGSAWIAGVLSSLSKQLDAAISYRHYEKDFYSLYGNGFSESTNLQNEYGLYLGLKYQLNKVNQLTGYLDMFQFPWLRYRGYAPSYGHEWMLRYNYQPRKDLLFYVQVREESKIRNHSTDANLFTTQNTTKRNFWANIDYAANDWLSFRTRTQFSHFDFETFSSGIAVIQDISMNFNKLSISGRYALFDTDDFENRQYVYEKDVWLAYSFPFYDGVGVRHYILMHYTIAKNLDLWLKWSHLRYNDRESISSGNETIEGNSLNDLKLQVRIRL